MEWQPDHVAWFVDGVERARTTGSRLIVQEAAYEQLVPRLNAAYESLPIGNPLNEGVLVGPLIDKTAFATMERGSIRTRG